jgi:hypothetical protein
MIFGDYFFYILGIKFGALRMLGKSPTTELYPQLLLGEEILLSPLNAFDTLVNNQLTIHMLFWTLNSITWISMPVHMSVPYCLIIVVLQ